jgi:restriction system protein
MWPTLHAIQELGGSASRQEVFAKVASGFPEGEQAEMMPNGRSSRLHYCTGWSLTGLKRDGVIDNLRQGVWALTERGRGMTEAQIDTLWDEMRVALQSLACAATACRW